MGELLLLLLLFALATFGAFFLGHTLHGMVIDVWFNGIGAVLAVLTILIAWVTYLS